MDAVPHGFRSTFRDWAGEMPHHPRNAVELCLAHAIDTKTEAAYRRGDMLEKPTSIMQDWADFFAYPDNPSNRLIFSTQTSNYIHCRRHRAGTQWGYSSEGRRLNFYHNNNSLFH